jgi:site-specific DNA recombinase
VVNQVEDLRIVSDELFERCEQRLRDALNPSMKLKAGGKSKFVLSGLLRCGLCGAHYQMGDAFKYGCGSYLRGGDELCANVERVRRDSLEEAIVGPVRRELVTPERVAGIAKKMEAEYARRMRELAARAGEVPHELATLEARLERLRARLKSGDPDMTDDESQAAIDRAELKRRELQTVRPASQMAQVYSALPGAAKLYVRQIEAGLDGDARGGEGASNPRRDARPDRTDAGGSEGRAVGHLSVEPCCAHATHRRDTWSG